MDENTVQNTPEPEQVPLAAEQNPTAPLPAQDQAAPAPTTEGWVEPPAAPVAQVPTSSDHHVAARNRMWLTIGGVAVGLVVLAGTFAAGAAVGSRMGGGHGRPQFAQGQMQGQMPGGQGYGRGQQGQGQLPQGHPDVDGGRRGGHGRGGFGGSQGGQNQGQQQMPQGQQQTVPQDQQNQQAVPQGNFQ